MKAFQIYTTTALGVICLVLCISSRALHRGNKELQTRAQTQQTEIAKGNQLNQIGQKLLREMAVLSLNHEKIKTVLQENGYAVTTSASTSTPEPESTPEPAARDHE